jgi:hypothetical protein
MNIASLSRTGLAIAGLALAVCSLADCWWAKDQLTLGEKQMVVAGCALVVAGVKWGWNTFRHGARTI